MKKIMKIFAFFIALCLLLLSVGCTTLVRRSEIKSGSGKFINCKEYIAEFKNQMTSIGCEMAPYIQFENIDDFKAFMILRKFDDRQRYLLAKMSDEDGKVELPDVKDMIRVRFDGNEETEFINWYRSDRYYYHNIATFNGETIKYNYSPATYVESVNDFLNEKDAMLIPKNGIERKMETYRKNGVIYTKFSGKSSLGFDSVYLYWTYSHGGNKYWVYESINRANDPELMLSEYEYRKILVKNSLGYSWIEINEELPFEFTPEFLDQFEFYSVDFNA